MSKSLQSVRAPLANQHAVCFGLGPEGQDHVIITKVSGEVGWLEDGGVNYVQTRMVIPPDKVAEVQAAAASFRGQGSEQETACCL